MEGSHGQKWSAAIAALAGLARNSRIGYCVGNRIIGKQPESCKMSTLREAPDNLGSVREVQIKRDVHKRPRQILLLEWRVNGMVPVVGCLGALES